MVKCDQCKTDHRWKYVVKFNGKIVAHLCSDRCLENWAIRKRLEHEEAERDWQQTKLRLYDHRVIDATSTKKE